MNLTNIVMQFAFLFAPLLHMHFVCEQVAPGLYRGLDPTRKEIRVLKEKGIKTIISMRTRPEPNKAAYCQTLGIKWVQIATGVFSTPKPEQFDQFLALVNDPNNKPCYACCTINMERSAAYIEAYRMKDEHWTSAQIYDEFTEHHLKRWWPPFNHYQGVIEKYVDAGKNQTVNNAPTVDSAPAVNIAPTVNKEVISTSKAQSLEGLTVKQ